MNLDIFELRRHIFHICSGIGFILMLLYIPYAQFILFIILILGGLASFLATQFKLPFVTNALCLFERQRNNHFPGKGVIFFFIGSLISLQIFPRQIALASIIILTFSDPTSHFIGHHFGKIKIFNKRKNFEGFLAGTIIGAFFASFFVSWPLAIIGATFAMFTEFAGLAMAGENIDDNLFIPLVAGTVMLLLRTRFGM